MDHGGVVPVHQHLRGDEYRPVHHSVYHSHEASDAAAYLKAAEVQQAYGGYAAGAAGDTEKV